MDKLLNDSNKLFKMYLHNKIMHLDHKILILI